MAESPSSNLTSELERHNAEAATAAATRLANWVSPQDMVGDLLKMDYSECDILVHDHLRQKVGGLPLGCFLLATRISTGSIPDPEREDTSLLLLRVVGQSRLPNATEADQNRFMAGQRVATLDEPWDAEGQTDQFTLHQLRYAGVHCRVLGTFRMNEQVAGTWFITFGGDVSNFYSGQGMKVYKPVGAALSEIVNFSKPFTDDAHPLAGQKVAVGRLKYAASEFKVDERGENVPVDLDPTDLVARRTALFGMSRTGKSNTTKVIASSIFKLRERGEKEGRVGQLIFDVNGEYANENTQDGSKVNAACLKNIARTTANSSETDIATYGLAPHPNDLTRKIVKINFYGDSPVNWSDETEVAEKLDSLIVGKSLIDGLLADESARYISTFRNTSVEPPVVLDRSGATRYKRAILVYRAALYAAGFPPAASNASVQLRGLFNKDLIKALESSVAQDAAQYLSAGRVLKKNEAAWDEVIEALKALRKFIQDANNSGYASFNSTYAANRDDRRSWHDDRLTGFLAIFEYANGVRALRSLLQEHDPGSVGDYAKDVADDLVDGKLVIFDQSLGDPVMNKAAAERIMWSIFNRQKSSFISPKKLEDGTLVPPPDIVVYAEEAHNLLPASGSSDIESIWSRIAKEGSKYRIGLVYATQEPSSIQSNILKNTDNWFVAHLNNSDETRELRKYYDFEDFVQSILQVADPGFLRMRTLSNPFIVPVQVRRFSVT